MKERFNHISIKIAAWAGSALAFGLALLLIIVWLLIGPVMHFSSDWLLLMTAVADVIMFLVVFSIQNTQNRDSKAIRLKLNELIAANKQARDTFIGLESLNDEEIAELDDEFKQLLDRLEVKPVMHKLHKSIKEEKAKRFDPYQQAEHLVDTLLKPFGGKHEDEK